MPVVALLPLIKTVLQVRSGQICGGVELLEIGLVSPFNCSIQMR